MITIIPIEPLNNEHALLIIEAFNRYFINGGGEQDCRGDGCYGYSNGDGGGFGIGYGHGFGSTISGEGWGQGYGYCSGRGDGYGNGHGDMCPEEWRAE